jgi:hypothetical protein
MEPKSIRRVHEGRDAMQNACASQALAYKLQNAGAISSHIDIPQPGNHNSSTVFPIFRPTAVRDEARKSSKGRHSIDELRFEARIRSFEKQSLQTRRIQPEARPGSHRGRIGIPEIPGLFTRPILERSWKIGS